MADSRNPSTVSNNSPTNTSTDFPLSPSPISPRRDRRDSDEWDASKVPPSRFQKRKGSIYAVPNSRDGHVDSNYAHKFHELHAEKGYTGFGTPNYNQTPSTSNKKQ
ncbi:hypothetical protein QBC40DRAFT_336564 [Triangularia verruculosa]|uniref:Uncharacterized protein n=1 Tax=Triangularia verruculosa TaxID=2587418 RepID=A0AAN6XSK5_9PEZI|nr:hypothetical protein QBC40DRAFT_336564 [Triangularia verruculosa]